MFKKHFFKNLFFAVVSKSSANEFQRNTTNEVNKIEWNPVNTDTKGTCHSVYIIWVSPLSGL